MVPPSLYNSSSMIGLGLNDNLLKGMLPSDFGSTLPKLEMFYAANNTFTGPIPPSLANAAKITAFEIQGNSITRPIPNHFGSLANLRVLGLGDNPLGDNVHPNDWSFFNSLVNCTNLKALRLFNMGLRGELPNSIVNLSTTMDELYLNENQISGSIPREIGKLVNLAILSLAYNNLTGSLPSSIGSLKHLVILSLSYNKFTGDIPPTLGGCVMLEGLYLEGNLLQGSIPSSFEVLRSLAFVDMSNNNISGSIPSFFDEFHLIIFLDLSHNKFEGEVSKQGIFSNFSAFSIIENSELCGGIEALHLPACPVKVLRNKKKAFVLRKILIPVLPLLAMLLACLALILYRRQKSRKLNEPVPLMEDNQYLKLSYQDLLQA
ncbi:LRR receptor-like serine/threonine-protein kinase EFR [Daucus carota subsp. sativus]|uniref:LRR receptor-like serine/threonine-protein kinase EFR n=1 Tax=Daucus carota subsp. sativus TaxID=79200 RepID=UPI0007F02EEF|nr:PREDICTED: LRR receptor-like serine/threonine-protein kinase EFR [Daucus carota subsp. sativus]